MWWNRPKVDPWDLQRIQARIEALESRPLAVDYATALKNLNDAGMVMLERIGALGDVVSELSTSHAGLLHAVDEGIQRTERAERRIRTTIRSARKRLADSGVTDDAVEAEAAGLRLIDGDPGEGERVPAVREGVEDAAGETSSISGVSRETLRRVRGY